jgi:dTDP-4-amino-4,6-dideoxygalactose transaminase
MAGKIDKYEWIDVGSSFVPSEVSCAILWAQLLQCEEINSQRKRNFDFYLGRFAELAAKGLLKIPIIPEYSCTNAHIFFLILPTKDSREKMAVRLKRKGISAFSHYVPLHSSPAGRKFGRVGVVVPCIEDGEGGGAGRTEPGTFPKLLQTDFVFDGLLRIPLWLGMTQAELQHVAASVENILLSQQEELALDEEEDY